MRDESSEKRREENLKKKYEFLMTIKDRRKVEKYEEIKEERKMQEMMRDLLKKGEEEEFLDLTYRKGYLSYVTEEREAKLLKERKEEVKRRYMKLKRLRPMLKWRNTFMPWSRRLVIEYHRLRDPTKGLVSGIEMIDYYCRLEDVYFYSPVRNTGYKYYTGQQLIVYIVNEPLTKMVRKRLKDAMQLKTYKEYDLTKCFRVILTTQEWTSRKKISKVTCLERWENMVYDYRKLNLLAWKGKRTLKEFFNMTMLLQLRKHRVDPWPYEWSVDILDERKLQTGEERK